MYKKLILMIMLLLLSLSLSSEIIYLDDNPTEILLDFNKVPYDKAQAMTAGGQTFDMSLFDAKLEGSFLTLKITKEGNGKINQYPIPGSKGGLVTDIKNATSYTNVLFHYEISGKLAETQNYQLIIETGAKFNPGERVEVSFTGGTTVDDSNNNYKNLTKKFESNKFIVVNRSTNFIDKSLPHKWSHSEKGGNALAGSGVLSNYGGKVNIQETILSIVIFIEPEIPILPPDPEHPVLPGEPPVDPEHPVLPGKPPVDPEHPVLPGKPPVDPEHPVLPGKPPVDPEHPVLPGKPPVDPEHPVLPGKPPVDPEHPVLPGKPPVDPEHPVLPGKPPVDPEHPVLPGKPPVDPEHPVLPGKPPVDPEHPVLPGKPPVDPEHPVLPGKPPVDPEHPVLPGKPPVDPSDMLVVTKSPGTKEGLVAGITVGYSVFIKNSGEEVFNLRFESDLDHPAFGEVKNVRYSNGPYGSEEIPLENNSKYKLDTVLEKYTGGKSFSVSFDVVLKEDITGPAPIVVKVNGVPTNTVDIYTWSAK